MVPLTPPSPSLQGSERTTSLEYPAGQRQQVTMLALDFGEREARPPVGPDSSLPQLDAPNVTDIQISALHDLNGVDPRKSLCVQASYGDQVMRSAKVSLDPDSAFVGPLRFEATFRLCAALPHVSLLLLQNDGFPV